MRYALLLVLIACRTQTLSPREVAAISPSRGAVSVKLVPHPRSPEVQLGPDEDYVPPQLLPSNPSPAYPPELVPLHLKPRAVALRITFDERGHPSEFASSPVAASTDDEHRAAFEAAAKEALNRWRCRPARIRKFRPGPDADGDGKPDFRILQTERLLKTFFDVSFVFEVINGVPVVKVGPSK